MSEERRRLFFIAVGLVLLGGFLLCGPAHHALHGADHALGCDSCWLSSAEAPACFVHSPLSARALPHVVPAPVEPALALPIESGRPRAPPRRARMSRAS